MSNRFMRMDGHAAMTKLRVAFRNFAKSAYKAAHTQVVCGLDSSSSG